MTILSRTYLYGALLAGLVGGMSPALPAQTVLTTIRIKSLNQVAGDLNTVMTRLNSPPMGTMAVNFLTGLAGVPSGTGVNLDKPACAYLMSLDDAEHDGVPTLVMVLPVSGDGSAYVEAINAAYMNRTKVGSLTQLSNADSPMAIPGLRSRLYLGREAGYAVVGENAAATAKALGRLREKTPTEPESTISITVGIQEILPLLESRINERKEMMAATAPSADGSNADKVKGMAAQTDLILTLLKQVDTFHLRLSAGDAAVEFVSYAKMMPNTLLAGIQSEFVPVSDRFKGLVHPAAYLALAGNGLQVFSKHTDEYMAMIKPVLEAVGTADSNMTGVVERQLALAKDAYSGDWSFSVVPTTSETKLGIIEFLGVKDMTKVRESILKGALGMRIPGSAAVPTLDVSVDEQAREYQGHSIMKVSYGEEAMSADPQLAAAMPVKGMFMSTEVCCLDDLVIMTWGGSDVMNTAIDLATSGGGTRIDKMAPYATLFPSSKEESVSFISLRPLSLISAAAQMGPAGMGAALMAGVPQTQSGVAGHSFMLGDKLISVVRIGYDELAGLGAMAQAGQAAAMSSMSGGPGMMDYAGGSFDPITEESVPETPTTPKANCINQLRMIDAAKELYAMENNLTDGAEVTSESLLKFLPNGAFPTCPLGSDYTIGAIGTAPSCAASDHKLP